MELINLHDFIENTISEFDIDFFSQDRELPDSFKEYIKSSPGGEKYTFMKYTTIVRTPLSIYCPNQWFYIAAYYCKLYPVLKQYKDAVYEYCNLPESSKEYQSFFSSLVNNYELAKSSFSNSNLSQQQVELLAEFLSDYSWWRGGKGIERADFFYSPILSSAALVNASQSYVAEICRYLVENPEALNILQNVILNHQESVLFSKVCESTKISEFLGECVKTFLTYDPNMSRCEFKINRSTVGIEGCYFGKSKIVFDQKTDPAHLDDCNKGIVWEVENEQYYFYKELNSSSLTSFKNYFNKLYSEKYRIVVLDGVYQLFEINNTRTVVKNQTIYFGAPGTGKSFEAKKQTIGKPHIRTIFHPDSDYASFIGCYKPVMENGKIVYKYRAQAFINAYINAWQTNEPYYLVIEEINRGNCAQIFGDIFQLLDRTDGESDYDVYPDVDLQQYIKDTFTASKNENAEKFNNLSIPEEILSGAVMRLPKNLSIIATMNTSDQSLFPMDSAFKRRWDWKYFAIKDEGKGFKIKVGDDGKEYDWWKTIEAINKKILGATKSSDKQIGYWFAKLPEGETVIDAERFVSKVVFYLWNDVFKDYSFGENNPFTRETTFEAFFDARGNVVNDVVKTFLDMNYPTE